MCIRDRYVNVQACPTCRGRGQTVDKPCETCRGQGRQTRQHSLDVDVPAGVEEGIQIRLTGEGSHGRFGGPPGDLFVVLQVREDPVFLRQGTDLLLALRLNAACGGVSLLVWIAPGGELHVMSYPALIDTGWRAGKSIGRDLARLCAWNEKTEQGATC